ncbi:MAG: transcription termination factor NusA [Clostridia bacterium]|nr:transcription termination factor NusA [Clostridia bacterium]
MNKEFFEALNLLEKEKGISKEYMIERVEAALQSAFRRENGGNTNVKVVINPEKQDVKVYKQYQIVAEVTNPACEMTVDQVKAMGKRKKLGDILEIEVKTKNFGRISAQTAKQVIIQGIREAERAMQAKEYESKKEEVITATVVKVEPDTGDIVVDTGTSNAVLRKAEQIPGETFEVGDHIKVFVMEVNSEVRGPLVTLSRSHHGLIKRLFELEVPEIKDGTVVIMSVSREAGSRSKISVKSRDENVDAVGACIGPKRSRITAIVDELSGEKIDVIPYSEVPTEYVSAALKPAVVESVTFENERACKVVVTPDQLSLAIGKEGQNVRLAARLTGFKIDIKTE